MLESNPCIYKIQSPSDKIYIGQTWNLECRYNYYAYLIKPKQPKLYNSIKKHGFTAHAFEILEVLSKDVCQSDLDKCEQMYIDKYRQLGFELLNVREGGSRGKHSEESKNKMRGKLGKWMIGRKLSKERVEKTMMKTRGKKRSEESKERYRLSRLGNKNPMFGKTPWNKGLKGFMKDRVVSDETRKKMSYANKGRIFSEEVRLKMSCAAKNRKTQSKGSIHGASKLTETQVLEIRAKYIPKKYPMHIIAKEYDVGIPCIFEIIKRKTWTHI